MSSKDLEAKNRILQTAMELMNKADDPASITVRDIAQAANVGVGLINYHFQSKDKLLNEAAATILTQSADQYATKTPAGTPKERLIAMLRDLSDVLMRYDKINRLSVSYVLSNGSYDVELYVVPLLRDHYGDALDEFGLRLLACQIVLPMQYAYLRPAEFRLYAGCDIYDKPQRDAYIARLIDNLLR